ncbi:VCBS repeat-containing protein [Flagellimonas sp. 2504JD4-2]
MKISSLNIFRIIKVCSGSFPILALLVLANILGCETISNNIKLVRQPSHKSGIHFSNNIIESDSLNYFNFPYMYMGGGVAIGDINNDGLSDIFFTGNMVGNKLYLNLGGLTFQDVTLDSGVVGDNRWFTGVTMVDINNDGWLDIYLCASGKKNSKNQLYVNNGDLTFSEKAHFYGIDDDSPSIQSTFFDYDNDGDLDLFVANYPLIPLSMGNQYYFKKIAENEFTSSGHLFKNEGDHGFVDVTKEAGVQNYGLSLGVVASDLNNDGWQDLYVSNDFQVPDYAYINQKDGTFAEMLTESFQHTSMFGMGVDAADFTNDGLMDLVQVDMAPENYKRAKVNMASMDPEGFWQLVSLGGHYQYMQNSLQVNQGNLFNGTPIFSEVSRKSGVALTDWSWGALFADLDNDGKKDLMVTNGIRRDVNNNDINNINKLTLNPKPIEMSNVPSEPIKNYIFKNSGDYSFEDISDNSGFGLKNFSNGIAYGDLDNDGDLDIVINNLDSVSEIYENTSSSSNNSMRFKLKGSEKNPLALGTKISIHYQGEVQTQELTLTRGFQSSVEPVVHFGVGQAEKVERVKITWPDGLVQELEDLQSNQLVHVKKNTAMYIETVKKFDMGQKYHFVDVTQEVGITYKHRENEYNDFQYEPLLPHRYSRLGPALAVGDINDDGLEDFYVGSALGEVSSLYIQQEDLTFIEKDGPWKTDAKNEDTGALFFDADQDGDLDLYVVSGGNEINQNKSDFQDRLYINQNGTFIKNTNILPKINSSGQVVISEDFDLDGDLDLFIGGRIVPGQYPYPANSILLSNEGGKNEDLRFVDATSSLAKDFFGLGLVTSALWQDFNEDNWPDLIVAGEWMPIRFFENNGGVFKEVSSLTGNEDTNGWWYSLESVDLDNDNDLDIVAGNLGLNYKYKTDDNTTFEIYANDFDENGKKDIVLSYTKKGRQLPVRGRECSSQQIPAIKHRFKTYEEFANADLADIYGSLILENSLKYVSKTFAHHWLENTGKGNFVMHKLPPKAQLSSINDIEVININDDSFPDLLVAGNLLNSEVETPRNDSSFGLVLENTKSGQFKNQSLQENQLFVKGEVKAIRPIILGTKKVRAYVFAVNNDSLKIITCEKREASTNL